MSLNDATEEPTVDGKREAIVEITITPIRSVNTIPHVPPKWECKEGGKAHLPSTTSETTNDVLAQSMKLKGNEKPRRGKRPFSVLSKRSRLQRLKDHNVMHVLMSFMDEVDLFQFENAHSEMIGLLTISRQWSYLSSCDENNTRHTHSRWRQTNEMDTNIVVNEIESRNTKAVGRKTGGDEDSGNGIVLRDHPPRDDLLARLIGRNFAEEAIYIREREKEASYIYKFERSPRNNFEVVKHISKVDIETCSWRHHWSEWYDYRANSVDGKDAFVRLSLRDGSERCWEGFRGLTTSYNTTFFRMQFNMKELIEDMQWAELEKYLKLKERGASDLGRVKSSTEYFMRMTQLTVSIHGKLLVATGGSRFCGFDLMERCEFHPRHYRLPLSDTTMNGIGWSSYKIEMAFDFAGNELAIEFSCDHADLPFMKAEDIGKPNACAHW